MHQTFRMALVWIWTILRIEREIGHRIMKANNYCISMLWGVVGIMTYLSLYNIFSHESGRDYID